MAIASVPATQVIWHGRLFKFDQHTSDAMMESASLPGDVADFLDLLKQRDLGVIVGGIALLQYVSGRNTEDLDLILALDELSQLPEVTIEDRNDCFLQGRFRRLRVDILLASNPLFEHARKNFTAVRDFSGRPLKCATPEGLTLLKLYALPSLYRQGDFDRVTLYEGDLTMLIRDHQVDAEPLLSILSGHMIASDVKELRTVLADIQQRIARFQRAQ